MTASKSLPPRPSLESLRKQARRLARDRQLSLRAAQLALAREYGYAGWHDLTAEVSKRLGKSLEWAALRARRIIHDNDVDRLTQLLADHPGLLAWQGNATVDSLLGIAAGSFGDSFDPDREQLFTRPACAELLLDAGAVVMPAVCDGLIESRARGMLQLFHRRGVLPRTLTFLAALGELDAVRARLGEDGGGGGDRTLVNQAFLCACRFEHHAVAAVLLERAIALDDTLRAHLSASGGDRDAFIAYLIAERALDFVHATPTGPWQAFVMEQVMRTVQSGDRTAFVDALQRQRWLLDDACVGFQVGIVERATLRDHGELIVALLELEPALLRRHPRPPSQALEHALTYAKPHLVAVLTRIWPVPDDLPHAAGLGDLTAVQRWFDADGALALGELDQHVPCNSARTRMHLQWGEPNAQQVLDTALAWAVLNRHFAVADFLLAHGADLNTNWSSHEPASILHELVFHANYESMKYLVDRGIDMTITDHRWNATAQGWARHAANDPAMAEWLAEAERRQRA